NPNAPLAHTMTDIKVGGHEAGDVGDMVVDPNNPAVVYLGGSERFGQPGDPPTHGLIRVDTRNMRDTTYIRPPTLENAGFAVPTDGDDITAALDAENFVNASGQHAYDWNDAALSGYKNNQSGVDWTDLSSNTFRESGSAAFVQSTIHALAFDDLGRLLVGTEGGLFRGISGGFAQGYLNLNSTLPGMRFTDLNGNLQIADLTSVAIDPTTRGSYFASLASNGFAVSSGTLDWSSIGLTGPNHPLFGNLGVPHGAAIRVAGIDPTAPPDSPATVYRIWAYTSTRALIPEVSTSGGRPTLGA